MGKVLRKFKVLCVNNKEMVYSANFELMGRITNTSYTIGKEYLCEVRDSPLGATHYVLNDYGEYEYVSNRIYNTFSSNFMRINQEEDIEIDSSLKWYIIIFVICFVCSALITLN